MSFAIEAIAIRHRFGDVVAVDGVDIRVPRGQVFGLLGPNGAGKTTLVRILSTSLMPDAGSVSILGQGAAADVMAARGFLGVVHGENLRPEPSWSARRYLRHFAGVHGIPRAQVNARISEVLAAVRFDGDATVPIGTLSGGNARKVEIARAIIHDPPVLFLDEPTRELDIGARRAVWGLVRSLAGKGTTVLLTTHDPLEIVTICQRIAILRHGQIAWTGSVDHFDGRDATDALADAFEGQLPRQHQAALEPVHSANRRTDS